LEAILGNKEIENEFYQFKEMFEQKTKKKELKDEILTTVKQIFTLKDKILASE
jgi:hypothetical protein